MRLKSPQESPDKLKELLSVFHFDATFVRQNLLQLRGDASFVFAANSPQNQTTGASGNGDLAGTPFTGDSIAEQPYDSNDDFTLHPLLQKIRHSLLYPSKQSALLQYQSDALRSPTRHEASKDRNGWHLLQFCAGTSAAFPHHKLATVRAEAASSESVPTDWLDLACVAHAYKLDSQRSQPARKNAAPHTQTNSALPSDSAACSRPGICSSATEQQPYRHEELPTSLEIHSQAVPANEKNEDTDSRPAGADTARLVSKRVLAQRERK